MASYITYRGPLGDVEVVDAAAGVDVLVGTYLHGGGGHNKDDRGLGWEFARDPGGHGDVVLPPCTTWR